MVQLVAWPTDLKTGGLPCSAHSALCGYSITLVSPTILTHVDAALTAIINTLDGWTEIY